VYAITTAIAALSKNQSITSIDIIFIIIRPMVVISARVVLGGSFVQLLRYTASSDARRTTVRLRSAKNASRAF
jgi:hypothetical protein